MNESEEASIHFLKLLDIAQRQKRIIDQWRQAEAQGPTDNQLWVTELAGVTADLHSLLLKDVTPEQLREFSEALTIKLKGDYEKQE
jgi:hypothetical protein